MLNSLVLIVYLLLVTVASLRPGDGAPLALWDKGLHFGTYAVFALLAYRALHEQYRFFWGCGARILYGGLIEVLQSYIPGRQLSGHDFLANTLGVVVSAFFVWRWRGWRMHS